MNDDPTLPLGDTPYTPPGTPELRDTWGPFRLLARVGSGGFGEVYRAWDPNLEREVALKLLLPGAVGGEEEYKAMLREARAMASVLHPNIVHVYGIDRHDGRVGFWTDFVKGKTLSALLGSQGPFGYREAALIGIDVSRALSAVHRAGLLHRDIKAENVMREEGGRILLMDFGLSAGERSLTGQIAGTPNYMAPELFDGSAATVCTDIYALGVLLYYLVIAEYPARLTGLTVSEAKAALARRTPLMDLRSDLPESFLRAVRVAMDLDPGRRYASAGQLADALAESMGTGVSTPAVSYTPVTPYAQTPAYAHVTPLSRAVPPPPKPPEPAPGTWENLFGLPAWFGGLSRKKKWAIFCVAIFLGQRGWQAIMPEHKVFVSTPKHSSASKASDADDDDDDEQAAEDMLRKAYKSSNVTSALKVFQQILQSQPDSATAEAGLGSAYFKQYKTSHDPKLLDLAKTATNRALALDKDGKLAEPRVTMANIAASEGQTSLAMPQAQKAISIEPKSAAAYAALANVYQAENKKADAITAVKKAIVLAPDQAEWPLQLGGYYFAGMDMKSARDQFQKSIDLDSDNAEGYLRLARTNIELDKLAEARDDYQKVTEIQPSAASYDALGSIFMLEEEYSDAAKAYQKAVDLSPLDSEAWGNLARAQRSSKERDKAIQSFDKAIDLGEGERLKTPDNPFLLVRLSNYYASNGKVDQSVALVKRGLTLAHEDPNIEYLAGETYELLGKRAEAITLIANALAQRPRAGEFFHTPELENLREDPAFHAAMMKARGEGKRGRGPGHPL